MLIKEVNQKIQRWLDKHDNMYVKNVPIDNDITDYEFGDIDE